tara:strand:+ start:358 stop:774 length:417 start_codon:yes stop_codon:yes gene_type:complete
MYSLSQKLNLNDIFPNKVSIWKLRCNNPMRKSFINNNVKYDEFKALIKLTTEMSKYLYPYIREILLSYENINNKQDGWKEFKKRYIELINERFNTNSMKVKKLLEPNENEIYILKILVTLSLCISNEGYFKLKKSLFN